MKRDYYNKQIAILGFGINNQELAPFLQERGAHITICDKNRDLPQHVAKVDYQLGDNYLEGLNRFDFIFRTPGIPYITPQIQQAKAAGVVITSQTQLFMEECSAKTIGITGTKGKGTTASFIASCLNTAKDADKLQGDVYLAGNIGASAIGLLPRLTKADWVILELSSFQLQDMTISPHIAVVLEITSDHLDHHKDIQEYHQAKKSLVHYQTEHDFAVLDFDSPVTRRFALDTPAKLFYFSLSPLHPDQNGAFANPHDKTIYLRDGHLGEIPICRCDELQLPGAHNVVNACAATVAAALAGVSPHHIHTGLTTFTGLPHRLALVEQKNGIRFYDDSKSTTPDSTIAAFRAFTEPITLILGGSSKGADYTDLITQLAGSHVATIICIGQEGQRLQTLLQEAHAKQKIITGADSMPAIVEQAVQATSPGGIVLLSPAAASFDMFKNAEDRGHQFAQAVHQL